MQMSGREGPCLEMAVWILRPPRGVYIPPTGLPPERAQLFPWGPQRRALRLCQPHLEGLKLVHGRFGLSENKDFLIVILE